ncbi:MAG: Nif3-like dinuclear metal center hexameric protein [Rhodocyclaceae bacterium]|nr:Nif3-like dinuclear metal center hexameric protein [Rhodocyclaceae bacterium]
MQREELVSRLDGLLEAARFKDYCPNGLQVEGRARIRRIVCGVSASLALVEEAIAREADALLVHHGWFWKGSDGRIVGLHKRRLARLLAHEINLIAYHLPLDAHSTLGNNAQLARRFGWRVTGRFGEQDIGFLGEIESPANAREIAARVAKALGREPLLVGEAERPVRRVAWASGAAQGWFEQAIELGVDLYLSGEISEPTVHLARESGVVYLAAGHHATERYGVMAVGEWLAQETGLVCEFVDLPNPV